MFATGDWIANIESFKRGLPTNPGLVVNAGTVAHNQQAVTVYWTDSHYLARDLVLEVHDDAAGYVGGDTLVRVPVSLVRHRASDAQRDKPRWH